MVLRREIWENGNWTIVKMLGTAKKLILGGLRARIEIDFQMGWARFRNFFLNSKYVYFFGVEVWQQRMLTIFNVSKIEK